MSKIKSELIEVTGVKEKRGEDEQDFLDRMVVSVSELSDQDWDGLSEDAQAWFNDAAEAKNKKKDITGFPEEKPARTSRTSKADPEPEPEKPARGRRAAKAEPEPEDKPARGRRAAAKEEPELEEYEPEVGDFVTITTKRGKASTGEVVEVDDDLIVIIDAEDDAELEFSRSKVESVVKNCDAFKTGAEDDGESGDDDIAVGSMVVATTKRGKVYTGEVIELDAEVIVIDVDGDEEELDIDKLKSLVLAKADPEPEPEKPARTSRSAKAKADPDDKPARAPKVTAADNGGLSVTLVIREVILDNVESSAEEVHKILTKKKLVFKDPTFKLIYSEVHRIIDMLKERKMFKTAR